MMERSSMVDCWLIPFKCSPKTFFIRTAVWCDVFLRHFLLEVLIDMTCLTRRLTDHNSAGEAAVWKANKSNRQDPARSHFTLCWRTDQQIIPSFSMSCFFVSFTTDFHLSPTTSAPTNQSQSAQTGLATTKNMPTTQHKSLFWPCLASVSTSPLNWTLPLCSVTGSRASHGWPYPYHKTHN